MLAGEHQISGLTSRRLQRLLPDWPRSRIGRLLRRLRLHGLIKQVGNTYNYTIYVMKMHYSPRR